ncbi:hypothetical protein BGX34_006958 [Mortierella sp. NVP85]|nr:hypothetical protein BGX34_006958 [Mortierella sp. NVP85]
MPNNNTPYDAWDDKETTLLQPYLDSSTPLTLTQKQQALMAINEYRESLNKAARTIDAVKGKLFRMKARQEGSSVLPAFDTEKATTLERRKKEQDELETDLKKIAQAEASFSERLADMDDNEQLALDLNQPMSGHVESIQLGSIQLGSIRVGSIQVRSSQVGSSQVGSSQLGSSQVDSGRVESARVE